MPILSVFIYNLIIKYTQKSIFQNNKIKNISTLATN